MSNNLSPQQFGVASPQISADYYIRRGKRPLTSNSMYAPDPLPLRSKYEHHDPERDERYND